MRNIRLLIQYDGSEYHGWQSQPNGVTIQEQLEESLEKITGARVNVIGAGRTDAGVHALGQCACFATASQLATDTLRDALNANLPADIRILTVYEAGESFHARFSAIGKTYVYIICTGRIASPFLQRYVWRLPYNLDIAAMRGAANLLLGRHDFSAFRGSGCSAKTTLRTLRLAAIEQRAGLEFMSMRIDGDFVVFRFEGDAFLRHMVRNMVGSLVEVGRGKMTPGDIAEILAKGDRTCAGPTAPAQGLFLERIGYAE
jgi:tRNA pseudouridine38-40 synthase